ncbi:MAG: hypothetical protein Kow006_27000 [Gammaproteobacteria bacterium]
MSSDPKKQLSDKYCLRFGQIAVSMGLITKEQLKQALCIQVDDEAAGRAHRLLGTILFDLGLLTTEQIDAVLKRLFQENRQSETQA